MKIIVTKVGGKFQVQLATNSLVSADGDTINEAIGWMIVKFPSMFNLEVEYKEE